jgi:hypothetical protein
MPAGGVDLILPIGRAAEVRPFQFADIGGNLEQQGAVFQPQVWFAIRCVDAEDSTEVAKDDRVLGGAQPFLNPIGIQIPCGDETVRPQALVQRTRRISIDVLFIVANNDAKFVNVEMGIQRL